MNGKSWTFQIVVPQESAAGIRGLTDKVQIVVKSGDPGGELGEFAYFMEGCLREWFDTVEVTCYNLSGDVLAGTSGLSGNQTLRWRTGPVPKNLSPGAEVFYKAFIDGIGEWCGVGIGLGDGRIGGEGVYVDHGDYMWLPLSDILALIGGE